MNDNTHENNKEDLKKATSLWIQSIIGSIFAGVLLKIYPILGSVVNHTFMFLIFSLGMFLIIALVCFIVSTLLNIITPVKKSMATVKDKWQWCSHASTGSTVYHQVVFFEIDQRICKKFYITDFKIFDSLVEGQRGQLTFKRCWFKNFELDEL